MHGLDIILCFQLRQTREIYKESKEHRGIIPRFQKTQPQPLILDQVIGVNTRQSILVFLLSLQNFNVDNLSQGSKVL